MQIEGSFDAERPLISVVVPIYNVEKHLDRCINSILHQTYSDLEIILVDDGSPDNCPRICDAWVKKDDRIRVVHKKNAGLGMARNTGIENATGEYICFFDGDDYILPQTIEKALMLAKETAAEIVVFGMHDINSSGQMVRQIVPQALQRYFTGRSVQTVFLPDLIDGQHRDALVRGLCLSACTCLFSMELVKRTGWRFVSERENISEDSYSLIWLYQHVKSVAILPEACYCYCENESSLTRTYRKDRYQRICWFYRDTVALVNSADYCEAVCQSVSGLFISFAIAAMKQIAAADIVRNQKREMLRQILCDETMQKCLQDISGRTYSRARQILFWAIRHKCIKLCHLLLAIQNRLQK